MAKNSKMKQRSNLWENLQGFRYAHRGLFHEPRSASKKADPKSGKGPLWSADIAAWKQEGKNVIPENSLEAFRMAVHHGFGSELDVHLTKDGRLAVFHDANLFRVTGRDLVIEDMTLDELSRVRLLDTDHNIPALEDVLDLYTSDAALTERGDARKSRAGAGLYLPLIIELKTEENTAQLCEKVMEVLDRYPQLNCCLESFDPRAVLWLKKNRPDVIRGQLTENFMKSPDAVRKWGRVCTFGMWSGAPDLMSRPDFVACKYSDRNNVFLRLSHRLGVHTVSWTIKNMAQMRQIEQEGSLGIFERFYPEG